MYYCVARNFWGVISASPLRVTHAARAAAYAKDHRASLRDVTVGTEERDDHLLVHDGLRPGDTLILPPHDPLKPGKRLRITE